MALAARPLLKIQCIFRVSLIQTRESYDEVDDNEPDRDRERDFDFDRDRDRDALSLWFRLIVCLFFSINLSEISIELITYQSHW